jgi:thioredoxin 1
MATVDLTAATFEETVKSDDIVLVDFWADWCGPCKSFAPTYEQASTTHEDVVFGKVDTEAEQGLAAGFGITSIPTLMAFREGVLVFAQPGALPGSALDQLIGAVRDLDMDDVRRQVAEAAEQMSSCASGVERFYRVNALDIQDAFKSIATAIQKIKLIG